MGSVLSGVGSFLAPIGQNLITSALTPGPSGSSPAGSFLGGLATSQANRPPAQTQPGAYSPPQGTGGAYNYIPIGQPGIDTSFLRQLQTSTAAGAGAQATANPMLAALLQRIMGSNAPQGLLNAAQNAGNISASASNRDAQSGGQLQQAILAALPQFQKILAQGTDPQNALYDRTLQQTRDQMGAQLSQQGLTGSGVGGAVENQGLSNFNIDWQNQQLARALSAMQGYGSAIGQAGTGLMTGSDLLGRSAQEALNYGALPYQATQTGFGGQQQAIAQFLAGMGGSQDLGNQNLGQMLAYLSSGQNANQLAAGNALSGAQVVGGQNAAAAGALSPLISGGLSGLAEGLSGLFSGGSSPSFPVVPTPIGGFGQDALGGLSANFASF